VVAARAFARADAASVEERKKAAAVVVDGATQSGRDKAARQAALLVMAGLCDVSGDERCRRQQLIAAVVANGKKNGAAIDAWVNVDDAARAVIAAVTAAFDLDGDLVVDDENAIARVEGAAAAYRAAVKGAGSARAPAGSVFAVRRAIVDVVADHSADGSRGVVAARSSARARATLRARLLRVAPLRGHRDTAELRAFALALRAALGLTDVDHADTADHATLDVVVADLFAADRLRAKDPRLDTSALPPERYTSRRRTRALCLAAEQRSSGRFSCDDVEERRFKVLSFVDGTREKRAPFDPSDAQATVADYDVLLQRCMKAGHKERLTTQTHVEIEWAIGNDGLVKSHDLRPMRLRGTSVDDCVGEAMAVFRYRPYPGEMQHTRLDFDVGGEL
jgi:hypothetical protein